MIHKVERELAGRALTIETGELAQQASGAVTIRFGDNIILATAVMAEQSREGIDFLPLTVDMEERHYAIGKIPGSFFRREGRPLRGHPRRTHHGSNPATPLPQRTAE